MGAGAKAPVILKRKKIMEGGGHHGGAWKVAMMWSFGRGAFCAGASGRRVEVPRGVIGSF